MAALGGPARKKCILNYSVNTCISFFWSDCGGGRYGGRARWRARANRLACHRGALVQDVGASRAGDLRGHHVLSVGQRQDCRDCRSCVLQHVVTILWRQSSEPTPFGWCTEFLYRAYKGRAGRKILLAAPPHPSNVPACPLARLPRLLQTSHGAAPLPLFPRW